MPKPIPSTISWKEYPTLLWLNLVVTKRNLFEYFRVVWRYYGNATFRKIDLTLLSKYFQKSPYAISKEFLIEQEETEIYAYGETPLTTMEEIAKECELNREDTIYELGCGRGRACFWMHCFLGSKVVGIEYIPAFVEKAQEVVDKYHVQGIEFRLENILESDYTEATVLYLYGTCFEGPFIKQLLTKFADLPQGTKIITVSFPLTDFKSGRVYDVVKCFTVEFTWGDADVYLHVKR